MHPASQETGLYAYVSPRAKAEIPARLEVERSRCVRGDVETAGIGDLPDNPKLRTEPRTCDVRMPDRRDGCSRRRVSG